MSKIAVVARADGRAGVALWGSAGKKYAGNKVWIGGKELTVTTDGRLNIPARVMRSMGVLNSAGRYTAVIQLTSAKEDDEHLIGARVYQPPAIYEDLKTGDVVSTSRYRDTALITEYLQPNDYSDWGDSP